MLTALFVIRDRSERARDTYDIHTHTCESLTTPELYRQYKQIDWYLSTIKTHNRQTDRQKDLSTERPVHRSHCLTVPRQSPTPQ